MSTSRGRSRSLTALSSGARHRARERALGLCYEAETKSLSLRDVLAELPASPESYAELLVSGVGERKDEIDHLVGQHATGWALERLSAIDRQILRIATFELIAVPAVPTAVILDEAVELAKEFSTEESGRFVNGVLATIALLVRSEAGSP